MLKVQKQLGLPGDVVLDRLTRPKGMRRGVFFLREARWFAARSKLKVRELNRKYKRRKTRPLIAL